MPPFKTKGQDWRHLKTNSYTNGKELITAPALSTMLPIPSMQNRIMANTINKIAVLKEKSLEAVFLIAPPKKGTGTAGYA